MASAVQEVVEALNREPFNKNLSLVTFDEKSPSELLQVLVDVLGYLDESYRCDVRDQNPEMLGPRLVRFLSVLKYQFPPGEREDFQASLLNGERSVIYPILHYLLSRLPMLKKRAYVARFLSKIEVPPEFLHDDEAQQLMNQLHEQQIQFKDAHKTVEGLRARNVNPAELRREIQQLEEEKSQLTDKIAQLRTRTTGVEGFADLLSATSSLRQEQEEESKLQERLMEQRRALSLAEKRYSETSRRLAETRANNKEDMSAEQLLDMARREYQENRRLLQEGLPHAIHLRQETLQRLQEFLAEPAKTEEDVHHLRQRVTQMESEVKRATEEVAAKQRSAGDHRLALFRQQAALMGRNMQEKEESVARLQRQLDEAQRDIEAKESKMSELCGPRYMRREDFKAYRATLLQKTNHFKRLRAQLSALRQETVVLARTEQVLKSRATNLDEFLRRLEERRGVAGYTGVQQNLEELASMQAKVDATKGKTLEEISRTVTDINQKLKEKKGELTPRIQQLREVRLEYTDLESEYLRTKGRYNNTKAGLDAQRAQLEQECDSLQEDLLESERQYHFLQNMLRIAAERLQRADEEQQFRDGEGRLLRDFATWKELYENKLAQQEQLSKQLRRQQRDLNDNASEHARQRSNFVAVQKLLAAKIQTYRDGTARGDGMEPVSGDGMAPAEAAAGRVDAGGANIMTFG